VQVPKVTVHVKVFNPIPKLVTFETGLPGNKIVPEPEVRVQRPVPAVGEVADINPEVAQIL
jgi:hypothetical protein